MASILKVDTIQDQDGNNIINESGDTITIGASGDTITIPSGATLANSGIVTGFESTGIDDNATSTAITIDSSERVGIGTASPSVELEIASSSTQIRLTDTDTNAYAEIGTDGSGMLNFMADEGNTGGSPRITFDVSTTERMRINDSGNVGIGTTNPGSHRLLVEGGTVYIKDSLFIGTGDNSTISSDSSGNPLLFGINDVEKMRVGTGGDFFVACTSTPSSSVGFGVSPDGQVRATVSGDDILTVNRLSNDGQLVLFRQNTVTEGNIAVSGATVSYNGFTGTHWSRFTDNSTPNILKGTVLESLDEMCDWYNLEFEVTDEEGNTSTQKVPYVLQDGQSDGDVITYNHEGTDVQATIIKEADVKHVKSKVSDTVDAKNVYGVFVAYDKDGEGYNDFYVASVGSFVVRIKANETIAKGDLLQSNGDGTAKVQSDDAIRASTFAKVLSTTVIKTYEDGSFIVPCSLMC